MGQKVYPTGFRLGITENWRSRWFAEKDYAKTLGNDLEIRKYLEKRLSRAAVSRVEIERAGDKVKVIILTARPGVVIGKKGAEIDTLRTELEKARWRLQGPALRRRCRDQAPRARRQPRCSVYRRAARGPRCLPSRYAQGCPVRPARPALRASVSQWPPVGLGGCRDGPS